MAERTLELIFEAAWKRDSDLFEHLHRKGALQVSRKWMEIPPIGFQGIGFDPL